MLIRKEERVGEDQMVKLKHHACARWPSAKKGSIDGTGGQGLVAKKTRTEANI